MNLTKGGNGGRVDYVVCKKVPVVLLPSSRPHQDVRVKGLGGWIVGLTMALANCLAVLDDLLIGARVGERVGPLRRVVDVVRIYRFALVRQDSP
jgi:hypothetical protein